MYEVPQNALEELMKKEGVTEAFESSWVAAIIRRLFYIWETRWPDNKFDTNRESTLVFGGHVRRLIATQTAGYESQPVEDGAFAGILRSVAKENYVDPTSDVDFWFDSTELRDAHVDRWRTEFHITELRKPSGGRGYLEACMIRQRYRIQCRAPFMKHMPSLEVDTMVLRRNSMVYRDFDVNQLGMTPSGKLVMTDFFNRAQPCSTRPVDYFGRYWSDAPSLRHITEQIAKGIATMLPVSSTYFRLGMEIAQAARKQDGEDEDDDQKVLQVEQVNVGGGGGGAEAVMENEEEEKSEEGGEDEEEEEHDEEEEEGEQELLLAKNLHPGYTRYLKTILYRAGRMREQGWIVKGFDEGVNIVAREALSLACGHVCQLTKCALRVTRDDCVHIMCPTCGKHTAAISKFVERHHEV